MKLETNIIDCKQIRDEIIDEIKQDDNSSATLVIITVGNDPSSKVYVHNKLKMANDCGFQTSHIIFDDDVETIQIIKRINEIYQFSNPNKVGIIVQQPLPDHINVNELNNAIFPVSDIDGFGVHSLSSLYLGNDWNFHPCTPKAVMTIIENNTEHLTGNKAVVLGRSDIVGKAMALELINSDFTVTVCHSKTSETDLMNSIKEADLIVSAIGKPQFIKGDMIKAGAMCIDVGISVVGKSESNRNIIKGDFDFDTVSEVAGKMTTVPGGVGLLTVAQLMKNMSDIAKR